MPVVGLENLIDRRPKPAIAVASYPGPKQTKLPLLELRRMIAALIESALYRAVSR
jgi:hypothetical protein